MTLSELVNLGFKESDLPRYASMTSSVVLLAAKIWQSVGVKPIFTSSHRTDAENEAAGGTKGSQHRFGRALDLIFPGVHPAVVVAAADALGAPGLAVQFPSGMVHVDTRPGTHKARWGETVDVDARGKVIKSHDYTLGAVLAMFGSAPVVIPEKIIETVREITGLVVKPETLALIGAGSLLLFLYMMRR